MQPQLEGWRILYCYAVPPGGVINKDNFDQYPLIECGTWISDNGHWMLQSKPIDIADGCIETYTFDLIPNTCQAMRAFFNKYSHLSGSLSTITQIKSELDVYIL